MIEMAGRVYYNWPEGWCEEWLRLPERDDSGFDPYDVTIIGAGVVGCALAWQLSRCGLRILMLDKNHDVGEGTSKANSAIIHTGFDAEPGTLESRLVTKASQMWPRIADEMKIPLRRVSAMVLAMDADELSLLPKLLQKSRQNGVTDVQLLTPMEAKEKEPGLADELRGALWVERESIIDPFASCYAFAETALRNGVDIVLGMAVKSVSRSSDGLNKIHCAGGRRFSSRIVINAAGLGSTTIGNSYGARPLDVNPRRGEFLVFDKTAGNHLQHILLPVPNPKTKGILVSPTIFGNVIAGPTAEDLPYNESMVPETTAEGLEMIRSGATRLLPGITREPVISAYAGLRCNCLQGQYQIAFNDGRAGVVTLTGIRSTGLTVSVALAEYIREGLESECGLDCTINETAVTSRSDVNRPGWANSRPFEDPDRLAARPEYGDMICYCEQISRGEILDALHSPLAPRTVDGIRRRTRCATGRCQGFNCLVSLAGLISDVTGIDLHRITRKGPGSELIGIREKN